MPACLLSFQPLLLSPFKPSIPLSFRDYRFFNQSRLLHGNQLRNRDLFTVRFGTNPLFPSPESGGDFIWELLGRAEGRLFTIADAVATSSASLNEGKLNGDWLSGITNSLESILKVLKDGISALHVSYAYGFAIILLTVLVKAATFPLTKKQVESAMAMRSLQPQIKAVQQLYVGDQERIQLETARLYKLAGVNPLAGCLPTLATIPVWIGLYRALSNVADEGLLTEGFFWIPSLSGPTTVSARQSGSGISWLFPFVDGHPPLGWSDTFAYLVLPFLLVASQYISIQIMQSSQGNDPNQKGSQALTKFLPLMIGYFALSVPSGLSLYWLTNNILSTGQQIWLQKLGGAKNPVGEATVQELQKPALDFDANRLKPREDEKLASGGLRHGERFKQIKEQEARRRQQREEEKRRADEADKGAGVGNLEHKQDLEFVKAKDTIEAGYVAIEDGKVQSVTSADISPNTGVPLVNVGQSTPHLEENQSKMDVQEMTNGATCNGGIVLKDEQNSENL